MSYRQLTTEEEKLDEGVTSHWEKFLFLIQEAVDFVNTQTPLITQNLESSFDVSNRDTIMNVTLMSLYDVSQVKF